MVLTTFGKSTGFCIDPIEKKPLNHFYPGTSVLSFGTAGCNLGCKFCQNWDISKSREVERLSERATPEAITEAALKLGCKSVAFTYNDPVIWAEYAIETARTCRVAGVKSVAVTAGYITEEARGPFFEYVDAANVDLKAFSEDFYRHLTYSSLDPVLSTIAWLKAETDVWFELTNLVIPGENDADDEFERMCGWVLQHCGDEVPVHFTAFHPDFRMTDRPHTPHETLIRAFETARRAGLKHVYVGNVNDAARQSTLCPQCGALVIERNWYELGAYRLDGNRCRACGGVVAGRFDAEPGNWGRKRLPVAISAFGRDTEVSVMSIGSLNVIKPATRKSDSRGEKASVSAISPRQKEQILAAAAVQVAGAILGRPSAPKDATLAGAAEIKVEGAYVTLKRRGQLRACCGFLGASKPLHQALATAAVHTAREDHRLPPISSTELPFLDLHVNLLFGFTEVPAGGPERVAAVEVGRHGLRIRRGDASGLLLPVVAVENGWDAESFLRNVCRKAGLPTTAWQDDTTTLVTFEAVEFGGPFNPAALEPRAVDRERGSREDGGSETLLAMAEFARGNIALALRGMTPQYYQPSLPDGHVAGLSVTIDTGAPDGPLHLTQLSLRPGVPIQATLFGLCEVAARRLVEAGGPPSQGRVGVTVFADPAMHGTAAAPDLRGLDPSRRALLLVDRDKSAWAFDRSARPEDLLETVRGAVNIFDPQAAGLYSLEFRSTESSAVFRSAPRPVANVRGARPPAVAGKFYPIDPSSLAALIDELLARTPHRPQAWSAAMVPHAGLQFSGGVAASVFNRLQIPELVIVLGPKHTRHGVDWAVMPHERWSIPGASIASDPTVAQALVEAIAGLELDASAHAGEHAIEVELPFLARLAPHTRVVGLAIGGGGWKHCERYAEGLVRVIRDLPTRPLLLISSDMNHFATDQETRRLDEMALAAMETLDPTTLLETVRAHEISMCGVLPAVIVMQTLRQLGGLRACERVSYATSADVSGDTHRAVGYAGMLFS
jgi:AmmeMemoRadiSam system radical SAM enzyme/AmmeMemoRadiSam system protein B/AmmeMemoRadiSam system protein A